MHLSFEEAQSRVAAVNDNGGNVRAASRALGMDHSALLRSLRKVKDEYGIEPDPRYVVKGVSTLTDSAGKTTAEWTKTKLAGQEEADTVQMPDPKRIVKRSTLYDQQGKVSQQWITEKQTDAQRQTLWEAFAASLAADLPRSAPYIRPIDAEPVRDELCACYIIGDHHLGMYSWAAETGADYDIDIASNVLNGAMDTLVRAAPPARRAVIAVLGDFFHYDSNDAVTPAHKNLLDADGRAQKMVEAGVTLLRRAVAAVRVKHPWVHLIGEPGNHDPYSMMFLRVMLSVFFENDKYISVDKAPGHFHYLEFGVNLIGTHHGDKAKMERLPGIMAADMAEAWGRTKHRTWWTGHVHHEQIKEYPGCTVESFGILAAPDAYAANHGYRSKRSMKSIILHVKHGEIARNTVNPEMLEVA
jgi:transposase-like protein